MAVLTGGGPHSIRRQPDGDEGKMLGLQGGRIERVPLEELVGEERPLDPGLYELAAALARISR